ncbi:MAG: CDGSH iron-sulfur domain-containing protein [Anaerolineae bacterium]
MSEVSIRGRADGPYLIEGKARYVDEAGEEHVTEGKVVALCRCGGSSRKPFCDGTHRKVEFKADATELTVEQ